MINTTGRGEILTSSRTAVGRPTTKPPRPTFYTHTYGYFTQKMMREIIVMIKNKYGARRTTFRLILVHYLSRLRSSASKVDFTNLTLYKALLTLFSLCLSICCFLEPEPCASCNEWKQNVYNMRLVLTGRRILTARPGLHPACAVTVATRRRRLAGGTEVRERGVDGSVLDGRFPWTHGRPR